MRYSKIDIVKDGLRMYTRTAVRRPRKRMTRDRVMFNMIGYPLVILFALLCAIPFVLILSASFTSEASILRDGFSFWPREFSLESYRLSLEKPAAILRAYGVTILVTVLGTVLAVFVNTMTGYVLQRKDFPLATVLSYYFFFTTLFTGGLVPTYILIVNTLKMKNTLFALFLPTIVSVWNILLVKGFIGGIPFEITEAAKLDGAGDFMIFLRFIVPLSVPVIATIALFTALQYWNDWYACMLYITDERLFTLQYFLHRLLASAKAIRSLMDEYQLDIQVPPVESMKMSLTIIVTGPIIFLYPFVQRFFITGLTVGSVKG